MATMHKTKLSQLIQDNAITLFRKKGYERVTVQEICSSVGTTKPTFYKVASSKAELLRHHYQKGLEDLSLETFLPREGQSWPDAIRRYLVRLTNENYDLAAALVMSNIQESAGLSFIPGTIRERVMEMTLRGQSNGEISTASSAEDLSQMLISLTEGFISYWTLYQGEAKAESELDHCLQAILNPAGKTAGTADTGKPERILN